MEAIYDTIEKISNADVIEYQLVDPKKQIRRCKVVKTKYLYYRIQEDIIELLTFRSTKQNPDSLDL